MKQKTSPKPAVNVSLDGDIIQVSLNVPVRFSLPKTKINLKFIIVFLRLLICRNGANLCTFEEIAGMLGYSDRRNINNFWREFQQHSYDILAYLSRKVDLAECIPLIEEFAAKNLILPIAEMHRKFVETSAIKMSLATFQKYLSQTCSVKLLNQAQKLLIQKFSGSGAVEILRLLADQHNVPVLCDKILEDPEHRFINRKSALCLCGQA